MNTRNASVRVPLGIATLLLLIAAPLLPGLALAGSCTSLLSDLAQPNQLLGATLTITQNNSTVSYARVEVGSLTAHPAARIPNGPQVGPSFTADAVTQLFNDRDATQPFSIGKADRIALKVVQKGAGVTVAITLSSWSNGQMGYEGTCDGNLLHGYANGAYYVISFQTAPPIR